MKRQEFKKRIEEISRAHTNANLYDKAKEILEAVQSPDDVQKLNEIIAWLEEARNFEVNLNFDPWIAELIEEVYN